MIQDQPETKFIFVSRFMMTATNIFNGNAFPETFNKYSEVCANRLALFLFNLEEVKYALKASYEDFSWRLISKSNDLCAAAASRGDLKIIAYTDGLEYLTTLHFALYSLKSFLDVYARLICRLINSNAKPTEFHAKEVNGKRISGEKFVRWIENSSPSSYESKGKLIEVIYRHSNNWITEAVSYRDTLGHYGGIKNMVEMRLPLEKVKTFIDINLIEKPLLPNGEGLDTYLEKITADLGLFLDETIPLLPNVDQKLVANWKESIKYLRDRKVTGMPSRNSPCPCGIGKKYKHCHGKDT